MSLGTGADGLEQFADDGCCLLPIRCGNGDGGEVCERVSTGSANNNNNDANNNANNNNANNNNANTDNTNNFNFGGRRAKKLRI